MASIEEKLQEARAQYAEDSESVKNLRYQLERLRDEYIENMYPMTGKEFGREHARLERLIEKTERRMKKTSGKISVLKSKLNKQ